MINQDDPVTNESATGNSPYWSKTTKVIVVIFALLAVIWLMGRFKSLIGMLVIAAILSYLLEPIISFIDRRTTIRRGLIIVFVYITLAITIIGGFFALGLATFEQVGNLITLLPDLIESGTETISTFVTRSEPLQIGPFVINPTVVPWERITDQLLGMLDPVFSQSTTVVSRLAASTMRTVFNVVFIFIISLYLAIDLPNFGGYIKQFAQRPGYRADAERLLPELSYVWRAYLRGQIILGLVIFAVVWIGLTLLGVQNSLALGLLGGLLEFVPTLGPVISAGVAILVAFFQSGNYLGLDAWQFALAVLILMVVIQQVENNLLVPRIVGGALDLHPVLVIVGVFMGAALAGILGAILAAPLVASLKVLGQYAWRKLFDLPPFPDTVPIEEAPPEVPPPSVIMVE
ncbi:MAG: AI-2E family transporter [Candidatus Promineofilum sp.]|nr:AI-2E family transporter [Promineifilum sp.]